MKKTNGRPARRLTLLTAAVLALALLHIGAQAAGSGSCGSGVSYTLSDAGVLTVSGTGTMTSHPWAAGDVTSAVIEQGVTSICNAAFQNCARMTDITIADSVTRIGTGAFKNCAGLTAVALPSSVTRINDSTFSGCVSLASVTIPDGVTRIDSSAFASCRSLTAVALPGGLTAVSNYTFMGCGGLAAVAFPDSLATVGNQAFYGCKALRGIDLPDTLTGIGTQAFAGCGLTAVTIPAGVTGIGKNAFSDCDALSRAEILGSDVTFGEDVFSAQPTVYCYEQSDAASWAAEQGYTRVFLDALDADSVRTVTLPDAFRLSLGDSRALAACVFPRFDHPAVAWSSSAPETVSAADGTATALAPGTAVITATVGGVSATVEVTAYAPWPVSAIAFEEQNPAVKQYATLQLHAVATLGDVTLVNRMVAFASSDADIATVDENGLVRGVAPGTAVITASADSAPPAQVAVTVTQANTLILPAALREIGAEAFAGLPMDAVIVPDGCTIISSRAFADCENLIYARIPADASDIADDAFEGSDQAALDRD